MIGLIRCQWAGEHIEICLSDDLKWECDHPDYGADVARYLQILYDPTEDLSPSRGTPGHRSIQEAAGWLEGTVELDVSDESDPNAIY